MGAFDTAGSINETRYPAIILAGGLGTRLRPDINDLPKPMAPVNGRPFLHYIFQYLCKQPVSEVILSVGYRHEPIKDFLGDEYMGIPIRYSIESEPMGTGGGIKQAFGLIDTGAYVLNGDTFFDVELPHLSNAYFATRSNMVLALKPMRNFDRYGTVMVDEDGRILSFEEKKFMEDGLINGGVYFFTKSLFDTLELSDKFSLEKDVLEKYVRLLKFTGRIFPGYFIDIGIPEDYQRAQYDFT